MKTQSASNTSDRLSQAKEKEWIMKPLPSWIRLPFCPAGWARLARSLGASLLAAGWAFLFGPDPATALADSTALSEPTERDCRLMLDALQALQKDQTLASLNLGVTVQNHVVTLWGPVPSAAMAQRARQQLLQVPGVAEVVNDLEIERPPDPLTENITLPFLRPENSLADLWNQARPPSSPVRGDGQGQRGMVPASGSPWGAKEYGLARITTTPERRPDNPAGLVIRGFSPPDPPEVQGSPDTVPGPSREVTLKTPVPVLMPVAVSPPPADLPRMVEQLQQSNPRLRWVHPEVAGGVVRLRGTVFRWEDLLELAQAIAKIPGVERVILEDVKTSPLP